MIEPTRGFAIVATASALVAVAGWTHFGYFNPIQDQSHQIAQAIAVVMIITHVVAAVIPWMTLFPAIVRMAFGLLLFAFAFFPQGAYLMGSPIFFYTGFADIAYAASVVMMRFGRSE